MKPSSQQVVHFQFIGRQSKSLKLRLSLGCKAALLFAFLLLCCQASYAATIDMYVSHANGVSKYFYDMSTDTASLDGGFSLPNGGGSGLLGAQGLAVGPDNLLYVVSQDSSPEKVLRFNRTTGAFVSTVANVPVPNDITFGPDQSGDSVPDLYVTEFSNARAVRIPTQGPGAGTVNVFTSGGSLGSSTLGLAFGPDGNLYISGRGAGKIEKFNGATGVDIGLFATQAGASPVLFSPDGSLFYSGDVFGTTLSQFDGSTGALLDGSFATGLDGPAQATFGPDFNNNGALDIYVANSGGSATTVSVIDGFTGANLGNVVTGLVRPKDVLFIGNIVPEPSSMTLFALGLALLPVARRSGRR